MLMKQKVRNQCHSGSVVTKQGALGQNQFTYGSNVGYVGCPGQVEGSVGHVGLMGHMCHWASELVSNSV